MMSNILKTHYLFFCNGLICNLKVKTLNLLIHDPFHEQHFIIYYYRALKFYNQLLVVVLPDYKQYKDLLDR